MQTELNIVKVKPSLGHPNTHCSVSGYLSL